jgi:hypothetical protein
VGRVYHTNNSEQTAKGVFDTGPEGKRGIGRPKPKCRECVDQDIRIIRKRNWKTSALNREEWKKLLMKAWDHTELSSQ